MRKLLPEARASYPSAARLAIGLTLATAAALTMGPLLGDLWRIPVAGSAEPAPSPLDGFWSSQVNGDRINEIVKNGDDLWAATDGGGLVRWSVSEGLYRQYVAPQDGLPSNEVNDLAFAPDGGLWLATSRGLTRLDTHSGALTTYTPASTPSMPSIHATALEFAADGRLWVGFNQDWDKDTVDERSREPGTWKPGGLALFDTAAATFVNVYHAELDGNPQTQRYRTIPSDNITELVMAGNGILWIGTEPYWEWDSDYCPPGEDCNRFSGYWVSVGGGLAAFATNETGLPTTWRNWSPGADSSCYSTHINDIAVDGANRAWVAHMGRGLHVMLEGLTGGGCNGGQTYYQRPRGGLEGLDGVKGNHIFSVDIDDVGRVWMGMGDSTNEGLGVGVLDHNNTFGDPRAPWEGATADDLWIFYDLDARPGSTTALVTAISVREPGSRFLGTQDNRLGDGEGLRVLDEPGTWRKLRTADSGIPSNHITDVAFDPSSGDVWAAFARRGIARYDGDTWVGWRAFQAGPQVARTTAEIRAGNFKRIPVDFRDKPACDAAFPLSRRFLRVGDDSTLYRLDRCLTVGGVVYIEVDPGIQQPAPNGSAVYAVDRGPPSDVGTKIDIAPDGTVWAGGRESIWMTGKATGSDCSTFPNCWLDGGLGKFDGAAWVVYDELNFDPPDIIPDQEVQAVLVHPDGKIWAGTGNPHRPTSNGIGVLDPVTGKWTYHEGRVDRNQRAWVTGVSDLDLDPVTGDVYVAMHAAEICVAGSPFGGGDCDQTKRLGGGVGRWDGANWQFWTKSTGAQLAAFGNPQRDEGGEMTAIRVDRTHRLVWAGSWDAIEDSFHYNQGRGLNAAVNWCSARLDTNATETPSPTATGPKPPITVTATVDPTANDCAQNGWRSKIWPEDGEVSSIAVDHTGNVWIGTHRNGKGVIPPEAGVKLWDGANWFTITLDNEDISSNEITALGERGDQMWVGTRTRGISIYTDQEPPTPTVTWTPRPVTSTPTGTVREPTPVGPTSTRTPGPGGSGTPTRTPETGLCSGNDPRCEFAFLPIVMQVNSNPAPQRTATSTSTRTSTWTATSTSEAMESPTATQTSSGPPSGTPSLTPVGNTATATRTRTATASPTATSGTSSPPPPPPMLEWSIYDGSAGQIFNGDLFGVYGTDTDHVWLVGDEGRVYFWDGEQFYSQTVPPAAEGHALRNVQFTSDTRGFIAGDGGALLDTRNGGLNWRNGNTGSYTDDWRALAMRQEDLLATGWALGHDRGTRLSYDGSVWDAGVTDRNTNHGYTDAAIVSASRAYATRDDGSGSRIMIWDGTGWGTGPSTGPLYSMHMPDATSGMAVGDRGTVWEFAGGLWQMMAARPSTSSRSLRAVHMTSPSTAWAGGDRTALFYWDGAEWTSVTVQARNRDIYSIWIDPTGTEGWAVGSAGLVLRYR